MSNIDGVTLAPGTKPYLLSDGTIRVKTERFGTGAKVGSIRLPDFRKSTEMYTRTIPLRSDEEIKEDIARIAREDAKKGQCNNQTKEWFDLKKEFISSASPDRESVVTNSTKQMFATANSHKSKSDDHRITLLELLMDKEMSNKKSVVNVNNATCKACFEDGKLTHAEYFGSNGEMIAMYDPNSGWDGVLTKEEVARQREFSSTYNEAWQSANAEMKAQNASRSKSLVSGNTFDVVG